MAISQTPRTQRADLVAVAPRRPAREVRDEGIGPGLRLVHAVVRDQGGDQRQVVHVRGRADADAALPLLVREGFVGREFGRFDFRRVVHDWPPAHREAEPVALGMAVLRRHVLRQDGRVDCPEQARLLHANQPGGVCGQHHVGGGIAALGPEAADHSFFQVDDVHPDARGLGEGAQDRLHQHRLAGGVDVDFGSRRKAGSGAQARPRG